MTEGIKEANAGNGILNWIGNALWTIISGFFGLIWKIIINYWYVLLILLIIILGIWIIVGIIQDKRDEKWLKRHGYSFAADDKLNEIAERVCDSFNRVELQYVSCSVVHIRVESQTGNSTWNCRIDFNDHGKISGKYVISSDNDQSSIPEHVADKIADEIRKMTIEELYG